MDRAKAYVLPAIAALVLLVYYLWRPGSEPAPADAAKPPATAPEAAPPARPSPGPTPPARMDADDPAVEPETIADVPPAAGAERERARDRARADALREQIARAQRRRLGRGDDEPIDRESLGQLQPEYIQQRVRDDLLPLAVECYENALAVDAELTGKIVLQFVIAGEPEVGGIVETAEATAESTIVDPELVECMRESMMTVSFEPPPEGGTVTVNYPFVFEPEDPK